MIFTEPTLTIALCAMAWCVLVVVMFRMSLNPRQRSTGLPLAFVLATTLMHCGALLYLIPSYDHTVDAYLASWNYTKGTVADGLVISTLGILGVVLGFGLANRLAPARNHPGRGGRAWHIVFQSSRLLVGVGVAATALGAAVTAFVPIAGLSAAMAGFKGLLLIGVSGFMVYYFAIGQRAKAIWTSLLGIAVVVSMQMLESGVLGDATYSAIVIACFLLCISQSKAKSLLLGLAALAVVSYAFLTASVVWMNVRSEIRATSNNAGYGERVAVAIDALSKARAFDGASEQELVFIDMRMNQNVMIGKANEYLSAFPNLYANGSTLLMAAAGWVPRAVWPDKPERGGSGFASTYSGQKLSTSASFGTGPIFEFLINFGWYGVVLGCIVYGFALRWLDSRSALMLWDGNVLRSAPYFVAGVSMVTPMDTMFFIVNGAVSGALSSLAVVYVARTWFGGRRRIMAPVRASR